MNLSIKSSKRVTSKIAFMPIKPIYAGRLLEGTKKYEFRKTNIKGNLSHIIIYASSPVKKIIGVAEVGSIETSCPLHLWENTKDEAGISHRAYMEYFNGSDKACAISIKHIFPLKNHLKPCEITDDFIVPQSFRYVDATFLKAVFQKGMARDV